MDLLNGNVGPAVQYWNRIWKADIDEQQNGTEKNKYNFTKSAFAGMPENIAKITSRAKLAAPNGCPWILQGKTYLRGIGGLHEEIDDFYAFMSPNLSEHQVRLYAVRRLHNFFAREYPEFRLEVFGSLRTGLYLPTSDIDMVLIGKVPQGFLYHLQDAFVKADIADLKTIMVIQNSTTKVPVIKFIEKQTQVKFDICLEVETGIKAAELTKKIIREYPAIPKLVAVLKQFLLQRDLNGVFQGGVSSYALILIAYSFLQHHPNHIARTPLANLGVLLIELLEFYSRRFNSFTVGIRTQSGGAYVPKSEVLHVPLPAATITPAPATFTSTTPPTLLIAIEDPFEFGNDISKGSYKAETVLDEFYAAFHILSRATIAAITDDYNPSSYLGLIIRVTEEVMEYRKTFKVLYASLRQAQMYELRSQPQI